MCIRDRYKIKELAGNALLDLSRAEKGRTLLKIRPRKFTGSLKGQPWKLGLIALKENQASIPVFISMSTRGHATQCNAKSRGTMGGRERFKGAFLSELQMCIRDSSMTIASASDRKSVV